MPEDDMAPAPMGWDGPEGPGMDAAPEGEGKMKKLFFKRHFEEFLMFLLKKKLLSLLQNELLKDFKKQNVPKLRLNRALGKRR